MNENRDLTDKWSKYSVAMLDVYNGIVEDITDVLKKRLDDIESRSNNDEPRSPEDKAVLSLTGEILDCIQKSQARYREAKAERDGS